MPVFSDWNKKCVGVRKKESVFCTPTFVDLPRVNLDVCESIVFGNTGERKWKEII